jgi:ABC-type transport system substrate-binding protein
MGDYDPARANAILDAYGYLPKHGGKWRDLPDGTPFSITYSTTADQLYRSIDEVVKKSFDALGIRMTFKPAQFPEQLKAAEAGTYSIWFLGFSSTQVNPVDMLQGFYGPASGGSNLSFFNLKEYDELYRQQDQMPDGPQRMALIDKMRDILNAYMPTKFALIPIQIYLWYPWLKGMRFDPLINDWWRYVDIDEAQQKPHLQ